MANVKLSEDDFRQMTQLAHQWLPDADPALLERAIRQAWALSRHDDFQLAPYSMVMAMLRAGIPVDRVVQIVAMAKMQLQHLQHWSGMAPPEDRPESDSAADRS